MHTKLRVFFLALLSPVLLSGQTPNSKSTCGTAAPPQQWEEWFGNAVKDYVNNLQAGKTQLVTHEIPVIVHIIHFGEPVGTFPNIDTNQVKSQIAALNADFAGTGFNVGTVPAAFAPFISNTGIKFCLANQNPQGGQLPEKGINRVNAQFNTWQNPNTPTLNIKSYIELYAKPTTMWDPLRYLNIWISDKPPTEPMNGYATYPGGTSLSGIPSGEIGTVNNDGIWIWTRAFGTVGSAQAPTDKGRTLTHEIGHWLGLRHIWGDGNCYTDYCSDTPWAKQQNTGCPAQPANVDACGSGQSSFGEMTMNFMDGTLDACKYMFTHDQNIRMQTALSQCNFRNALGTHNLCNPNLAPSSPAVAGFNLVSVPCIGAPFTPFNTSSGNPPPTFIWSSSPPAIFNPAPSVANPAISLSTPGNYTLTLIATNSITSSTYTYVVNSVSNCGFVSTCMDTLTTIKNTDTLNLYNAPNSAITIGCQTGFAGFLTGTNCYKDKEFAQFFPPSSYTAVPSPQVNSAIVLFADKGTSNGSNNSNILINCRVYGGNVTSGPGNQIGSSSLSLSAISSAPSSTSIAYVGNPNLVYPSGIVARRFDFASPVIVNASTGFYVSVDAPYYSTGDSIRIYSSQKVGVSLDSNAWFLQFSNNWRTFRTFRNSKIQLGIIPIITCSPLVGIEESASDFSANIHLMPNPGSGLFNLVFSLPKTEQVTMRITNAVGQEITKGTWPAISSGAYQIDLSNEPDGIYFVELSSGQNKVVKKLILRH
jgi:hypothetical protein